MICKEPRKIIAIDFDGCLCTFAYPEIGAPNWDVIAEAKREQEAGAGLILWTCRVGKYLQEAVDACAKWGLMFDAVNENLPERIEAWGVDCRKVSAEEYWDDRAVNMMSGRLIRPERMSPSPFINDPFALIWKAFKNLYPEKECEVYWEPNIRDSEGGDPVYGMTDFGEDGSVAVFVKPSLKVTDAVEILGHELAHVAVGVEHDHDQVWMDAFDAIFQEYNRIGDEMFGAQEPPEQTSSANDGK